MGFKKGIGIMSTLEEENLMEYLENIPFEYRERLYTDPSIKFGTEIEFMINKSKSLDKIYKLTYKFFDKKIFRISQSSRVVIPKFDKKIYEIKTPVLSNDMNDFVDLKKICEGLDKEDVVPGNQKGVHVHIDLSTFENNQYYLKLFLQLFCIYEHIISRFSYGEEDISTINYASYSREISSLLYDFIKTHDFNEDFDVLIQDLREVLRCKSYALNFHQKDDNCKNETIEFRTFNGTFNPTIIQNDINMCLNMVNRIIDEEVDVDLLDYRFKEYNKGFYIKESYSKLFMEDAIEFSDLIFNYNKDKDYFLRQYAIKSNPRKKKLVI